MSRIGKKIINVPDKVEVKVQGTKVSCKGPKGQLEFNISDKVQLDHKGKTISIKSLQDGLNGKAIWGTTRSMLQNMVTGVSEGFSKVLEFNGVGYKAAVRGNILELSLGYSHPINFELPHGVSAKVDKNTIIVTGIAKDEVGQVCANISSLRGPEPYKGKGVKYIEEKINRKAGKTAAAATK
jgi:large subunit ribosomal protein L6